MTKPILDPTRPAAGKSVASTVDPLADLAGKAAEEIVRLMVSNCRPDCLASATRHDRIVTQDWRFRASWFVFAVTFVETSVSHGEPDVRRALQWFGVDPTEFFATDAPLKLVAEAIGLICRAPNASALFPYILDTFGSTSRLAVARNPNLKGSRMARKRVGSFYTPSDVADFMVGAVAGKHPSTTAWLDPACGSGIFLRTALDKVAKSGVAEKELVDFATNNLWGYDISPQACDFAAFALCHRVIEFSRESPIAIWTRIRSNLTAADATRVTRDDIEERRKPAQALRLVCNPPYTRNGPISSKQGAIYLSFIEMAWTLADGPNDASALVVPLAFAANTTADHVACRAELQQAGGDWTMLFFDRQPHALFGEEAKTRSAILFRRSSDKLHIRTSELLKWTSKQRTSIFNESRTAEIAHPNISRFVPKFNSAAEAALYDRLISYRLRSAGRPAFGSAGLESIFEGRVKGHELYVSGTAYNFLNVFCACRPKDHLIGPVSASAVHRLSFTSHKRMNVAMALLTSRIAFWLWRVEGDGFHVTRQFLEELPLFDIVESDDDALAGLGEAIWDGLRQDILVSHNGGKRTLAFRPTAISQEREAVDGALLDALGEINTSVSLFREMDSRVTSVDGRVRLASVGHQFCLS